MILELLKKLDGIRFGRSTIFNRLRLGKRSDALLSGSLLPEQRYRKDFEGLRFGKRPVDRGYDQSQRRKYSLKPRQ